MNFGGLIAGALGGGAQALGEIADNRIKLRDVEAAEQRRALIDEERANRAMDRKLQLEEKQRELKGQRLAQDYDRVDAKATEIGQTRSLDSLVGSQAGVGSATNARGAAVDPGPAASREEMAAMMADPKNRQIYEDAGYIPKTTASGLIRDKMTAAQAMGADPEIRTELRDEFKTTEASERAAVNAALLERRQADVERRTAETERKNQANEELRRVDDIRRDKQIAAAVGRANGGGSGSREALSFLTQERLALTADKSDLRAREAAVLKNVPDYDADGKTRALAEFRAANKDVTDSIRRREQFLDTSMDKVRDRVGLSGDKPVTSGPAKPSGLVTVTNKADFDKLKSGTRFTAPDGSTRIKP